MAKISKTCFLCKHKIRKNSQYIKDFDTGNIYHKKCYKKEFGKIERNIKSIDENISITLSNKSTLINGLVSFAKIKEGQKLLEKGDTKSMRAMVLSAEKKGLIMEGASRQLSNNALNILKDIIKLKVKKKSNPSKKKKNEEIFCACCKKKLRPNTKYISDRDTGNSFHIKCYKEKFGPIPKNIPEIKAPPKKAKKKSKSKPKTKRSKPKKKSNPTVKELQSAVLEEEEGADMYEDWAQDFEEEGRNDYADLMRVLKDEETQHAQALSRLHQKVGRERLSNPKGPLMSREDSILRFFVPKAALDESLEKMDIYVSDANRRKLLKTIEGSANMQMDFDFQTPEDVLLPHFWSDKAPIPKAFPQPPDTEVIEGVIYQDLGDLLELMDKPKTKRNFEYLKFALWADANSMVESDLKDYNNLKWRMIPPQSNPTDPTARDYSIDAYTDEEHSEASVPDGISRSDLTIREAIIKVQQLVDKEEYYDAMIWNNETGEGVYAYTSYAKGAWTSKDEKPPGGVDLRLGTTNPKGQFILFLNSEPNIDFGETEAPSLPKKLNVSSLEEAKEKAMEYRDKWNLGGGNWGHSSGMVLTMDDKPHYKISYNGNMKPWDQYVKEFKRLSTQPLSNPTRLATLTPKEHNSWENSIIFFINDGHSDEDAADMAWNDMKKQYPRLKQFEGIDNMATMKAIRKIEGLQANPITDAQKEQIKKFAKEIMKTAKLSNPKIPLVIQAAIEGVPESEKPTIAMLAAQEMAGDALKKAAKLRRLRGMSKSAALEKGWKEVRFNPGNKKQRRPPGAISPKHILVAKEKALRKEMGIELNPKMPFEHRHRIIKEATDMFVAGHIDKEEYDKIINEYMSNPSRKPQGKYYRLQIIPPQYFYDDTYGTQDLGRPGHHKRIAAILKKKYGGVWTTQSFLLPRSEYKQVKGTLIPQTPAASRMWESLLKRYGQPRHVEGLRYILPPPAWEYYKKNPKKVITLHTWRGLLDKVTGIPKGWDYEEVDLDGDAMAKILTKMKVSATDYKPELSEKMITIVMHLGLPEVYNLPKGYAWVHIMPEDERANIAPQLIMAGAKTAGELSKTKEGRQMLKMGITPVAATEAARMGAGKLAGKLKGKEGIAGKAGEIAGKLEKIAGKPGKMVEGPLEQAGGVVSQLLSNPMSKGKTIYGTITEPVKRKKLAEKLAKKYNRSYGPHILPGDLIMDGRYDPNKNTIVFDGDVYTVKDVNWSGDYWTVSFEEIGGGFYTHTITPFDPERYEGNFRPNPIQDYPLPNVPGLKEALRDLRGSVQIWRDVGAEDTASRERIATFIGRKKPIVIKRPGKDNPYILYSSSMEPTRDITESLNNINKIINKAKLNKKQIKQASDYWYASMYLSSNPTHKEAKTKAKWHRDRGKRARVIKTGKDDYEAFIDGQRRVRKKKPVVPKKKKVVVPTKKKAVVPTKKKPKLAPGQYTLGEERVTSPDVPTKYLPLESEIVKDLQGKLYQISKIKPGIDFNIQKSMPYVDLKSLNVDELGLMTQKQFHLPDLDKLMEGKLVRGIKIVPLSDIDIEEEDRFKVTKKNAKQILTIKKVTYKQLPGIHKLKKYAGYDDIKVYLKNSSYIYIFAKKKENKFGLKIPIKDHDSMGMDSLEYYELWDLYKNLPIYQKEAKSILRKPVVPKKEKVVVPTKKKAVVPKLKEGKLKASDIPKIVKEIMPKFQQKIIVGSEEHWEVLERLQKVAESIPKPYAQSDKSKDDTTVYLHYFYGGIDQFITEWDGKDTYYGYGILNSDYQNSEFGYISRTELVEGTHIELDFFWTPKSLQKALEGVSSEYYGKVKVEPEEEMAISEFFNGDLVDYTNAMGIHVGDGMIYSVSSVSGGGFRYDINFIDDHSRAEDTTHIYSEDPGLRLLNRPKDVDSAFQTWYARWDAKEPEEEAPPPPAPAAPDIGPEVEIEKEEISEEALAAAITGSLKEMLGE